MINIQVFIISSFILKTENKVCLTSNVELVDLLTNFADSSLFTRASNVGNLHELTTPLCKLCASLTTPIKLKGHECTLSLALK